MSLFHRVRFVLVETSRPGNIGAAARAMKTMGFSELVLVRPRRDDALREEEAVAFASGAQDILAGRGLSGRSMRRWLAATLPPRSAPACGNTRRPC